MTKIFLTTYYMFVFFILYSNGQNFFTYSHQIPEFVMFAGILNIFPESFYVISYPIILTLGLVTLAFTILKPERKMQIVSSIMILIIISMKYSFGKISHGFHPWLISSVLICFLSVEKPLNDKKNLFILRLTQSLLLCTYLIAGLWKVRHISFSNWKSIGYDQLIFSMAEGNGPSFFLKEFFLEKPYLVIGGFFTVVLFQLSTIIPIAKSAYFKQWGVIAVLFHFTTGASLGIWFKYTVYAILLFMIFAEILMSQEKKEAL